MEQLTLNREHEDQIAELRKELREGNLEVKNHGTGKTPIRWRSILSLALVLLIMGGAFYVIYFKPFSQVEEIDIADTSSFKQFTKEERNELTSLIQSMGNPLLPDEDEIDPGIPIGLNTTLTFRTASQNDLFEQIYTDLSRDAEIQQNQMVDS